MNHISTGIKLGEAINNSTETYLFVVNNSYQNLSQTGGGIIGLILSWGFVSLLDKVGTYIILCVICLFGLIMVINITFSDFIGNIVTMWNNRKKPEKMSKKEESRKIYDQDEEDANNDILVNTVEDLKKQTIFYTC